MARRLLERLVMKLLRLLPGFALVVTLAACGGSGNDGGGPPRPPADPDTSIVPGVPGTCQKLCCSDADCAGGTCQALDPSSGTIGVCAGSSDTWPSSGALFVQSCWTRDQAQCNPLDNSGCDDGEACDFDPGDDSMDPTVGCFAGEQTLALGEACDAVYGPLCQPGLHCLPNAS
jgi:hypothetical protein